MERIIYLGGLGEEDSSLSKHLKSRMEVGRILQSGPIPTTFLRGAMDRRGSGTARYPGTGASRAEASLRLPG